MSGFQWRFTQEESHKKHLKAWKSVTKILALFKKKKILVRSKKAERCSNADKEKKRKPLANLINFTCPARSFQLIGKFAWLNIDTEMCKSIHSEWKIYFNLKMFRLQQ